MCGRFALYTNVYEILNDLEIIANSSGFPIDARYNITPSQKIITIFQDNRTRLPCVGVSNWGLIPSVMTKRYHRTGIKPSMFHNARMETITQKPSFSRAFNNDRCLIPADGFYEWDKDGEAHFFTTEDEKYMLFSGIYEITVDPYNGSGNQHKGSAIITTQAPPVVATVHKRSPVILSREYIQEWLDIFTPAHRLIKIMEASMSSVRLKKEKIDPAERQEEYLKSAEV